MTSEIHHYEKQLSDNTASVAHSVAGGLSGVLANIILYPLETLKYQQQAVSSKSEERGNGKRKDSQNTELQRAEWKDLLTLKFYETCYRGLGISLLETGCFHGTHFYFHTLIKKIWIRHLGHSNMTAMESLLNGSLAGLMVQLLTSPLKVLQIKSVLFKNKTSMQLAREIYKQDGILGFWKGFGLNAILTLNPAVTFLVYERLRKELHRMGHVSPAVDFLCGFLGKVIATYITYPVMLLKTQSLSGLTDKHGGIFNTCKKITIEQGISGW
eukprot:CAMPEP_0184486536 /NCGR_PEP_ID=MMETSP0113_2-20130426/8020_1 /TAXON_ID=91329 /ORGANISM="Norrisiella sphaerica, Strain BC52" /LENGTH=269 /DNA_ID=CAMNT_0026868459 /DNA_START=317 /DNA_END=1123 /DNA_ORIENTATION=-